jgi:hypothetical protein
LTRQIKRTLQLQNIPPNSCRIHTLLCSPQNFLQNRYLRT